MKKVKFSKYEKMAGVFLMSTVGVLVVFFFVLALQQGWFQSKVELQTELLAGGGLRRGTGVQMAGLKVGSVTEVRLNSANNVLVRFKVQQDYFDKIKSDSVVTVLRPFLIGEKVLDISVGSAGADPVFPNSVLPSQASPDMLDLLSGPKVGFLFENMSTALENLRYLVEAFSEEQRTKDFVEIYDEVKPLVKNLSKMAQETHWLVLHLNKKERMVHLVDELRQASSQVNEMLPGMKEEAPQLMQSLTRLTKNLDAVTQDLAEFLPSMREFGPELPQVGRRAIEALDETVITLKAMQKSMFLRGAAQKVREEEEQERQRVPATDSVDVEAE